jgi:hypothetical protein
VIGFVVVVVLLLVLVYVCGVGGGGGGGRKDNQLMSLIFVFHISFLQQAMPAEQ